MKFSTRSRYGLRAMISIAKAGDMPVSSELVAGCEDVSKKYLDGILGSLREAGLLESHRGQGGGYTLARDASDIKVSQIVRVLEGGFSLVNCVGRPQDCGKAGECPAREVWCAVSAAINSTLSNLSLQDLVQWEPAEGASSLMFHI